MKISQKVKKLGPPHTLVASLITDILETSAEDLPQLFSSIETWKWPRSDLNTWIDVLNKLDTVLEDVIREYNIDELQVNAFHPRKKELVCEVLKFERLLLENTTNRKLFNSYDRLNSLLFTSDLEVLVSTLFLLLRPSQQYSAHPALSYSQHISTSRLESLSKAPPSFREHGIELLDLVSNDSKERLKKLPQEASEVNHSFYRKTEDEAQQKTDAEASQPSASSTDQPNAQASKPYTIHLGPLAQSSRPAMDIFADAVKSHRVPDSEKYELLCRIRLAHALGEGRDSERQAIVTARLLALAVYAHTHPETQAQSTIFLYDTDLINRVSELLQQDKGVPVTLQTAAISALDALARYRGRMGEVLSGINAGVNHGILMSLLRKTVQDVCDSTSPLPNTFVDALISFITYIASHTSGGNMVVGAGLVPLLIQVIGIPHQLRLPIVSRTMQLIDNILIGYPNAFTIFCNSRGLDALTERIQYEVDLAIGSHGLDASAQSPLNAYGLVMFTRAGVLKHLLRSMHRMMQSSGTTEGMRGLIDSSLLKSVSKIIQYRGVFGPSIVPIAINVVATFVHNEPTSLTAIQEAGVPETAYSAIETGIEPSFEVVQAITNALGALCLNQTGQEQLANRPSIIPALFSIFTSEKHLKILTDKENAASIGSSIDELVRHHPSLKDAVFSSLLSTLRKIECMGNAYEPPNGISHFYMLKGAEKSSQQDDDVTMQDASAAPGPSEASSNLITTRNENSASVTHEQSEKPHDNPVVNYIDCLGRFLEGLFQHATHCNDFISSAETLNCFSRLFALPCLPYDYANAVHSDAIVQVIRTMVEVAPVETLTHLAEKVKESLDASSDFWQATSENSKLLPFVEIQDEEDFTTGNNYFRNLVTLHNRLTLLSDVFATAGYAHSRNAMALLQSNALDIIPSLGRLHRACIWENIVLKNGLAAKNYGTNSKLASLTNPLLPSLPSDMAEDVAAASAEVQAVEPSDSNEKTANVATWTENATALRHMANQIPNALGPFFQAISKMLFYNRRSPDDNQKRQAIALSETLAGVMHKHLTEYTQCDKKTSHDYHTVMLGLITVMLFDERSSQNSYHAVLLYAFRINGGLMAVLDTCRRYTDEISRISDINQSERSDADKEELVQVYGGLKMALHLIYSLISFRPSTDPISQFISQGKAETHPDYYEPHDFLVKIRLAVAPLINEMWRSSWLVSAPPLVSKYVVQSVQVLVAGSNESPPADFSFNSEIMPSSGQGLLRLSGPPSEDRIRQLTDMGFQRGAAIRALQRTNNNVNFATEYLLSHPYETGPENTEEGNNEDGNNAAADEVAPADNAATTDNIDNSGNADNADAAENAPAAPPNNVPDANEGADAMETEGATEEKVEQEDATQTEKTAEERRKEMDEIRKLLLADIGPLSLRLADAHPSLIFEIKEAFIGPSDKYQADAIRCIVEDIEKFSPAAYDVKEEPLLVRIRLLALILAEFPKATVEALREGGKGPQNLLNALHALLLSHPIGLDKDQSLPAWLAALLLAMESMFVLAGTPQQVSMVLPEQPVETPELYTGPSYKEARATVFELCMRLLQIQSIPRDDLLATLRMLVLLTRNRDTANQFIQRDGVSSLMQRMKGPSTDPSVSGTQVHIIIILRHLVEDRNVLETVMRQEIKRWFSSARSKGVEVLTYVRNSHEMAARDPQIFIETTKELCSLVRPDVPTHQIMLRSTKTTSSDPEAQASTEEATQMQVDDSAQPPAVSSEILEHVVHYILSELFRVGKIASDKLRAEHTSVGPEKKTTASEPNTDSTDSQGLEGSGSAPAANEDSEDAHAYACFLMQSLSELLFSYHQCKLAFLTYGPKKHHPQTPVKDAIARQKSAALNFLLSELVSFGAFNVEAKFDAKKRIILCNWAMSVIVALCVDNNSAGHGSSNQSPDLSSIRKLVMESIGRSIKESPANEPVDARYGRTLALADLCHRLLTVRLRTVGSSKASEETPMQLAKIMLEKSFVATLTNVLSDVDLNYPNMRSLVTAILRPLEYLTKVAIKMGRASDKGKDTGLDAKSESSSSSISSEDEEADMDVEDREETPDLYRNSSLGMYAGEMEDAGYNDGDETMDEGDDDEDEDVEVDYDGDTGSDDSSNTDPEDEADEEVIAADVDGPTNAWDDADEEMEEAEDDDVDEDDEDEDEADIDDDDEDGEMMWQGAGVGDVAEELVNDAGDDEDLDEVGMIDGDPQAGENEDADAFSEDHDLAEDDLVELDNIAVPVEGLDNPFGFSSRHMGRQPGFRSQLFLGGGVAVRDRMVDTDMQIFSRPRYSNTNPEAMTHPLLLDTNVANPPSGQIRVQTRRSRFGGGGLFSSAPYPDLLQTIEELVGGGALQLVQELMNRGGLPPLGADIHVEVPPGAAGLLNPERGALHRHGRTAISTSVGLRDSRAVTGRSDSTEFGPLPTIQRWQQEAELTHGKHAQERVQRLCNHIILALLPEARETARIEKEREEKERAAREAVEKEKAAQEEAERLEKEAAEKVTAEKEAAEKAAAEQEARDRDAVQADTTVQGEAQTLLSDQNEQEASTSAIADAENQQTSGEGEEDSEMLDATGASEESTALPRPDLPLPVPSGSTEASRGLLVPERVYVTIHGERVDITETGIDPTFLEALPDDMREEVLNQHLREMRASRDEPPADSQINTEFLDALPPEIRAEILREERLERSRRERQQNTGDEARNVALGGPTDIDAADFIASLDPQLRQVVLLDSDDGILQTLPSHIVAEAGMYRGIRSGSIPRRDVQLGSSEANQATAPANRKAPQARDAIQLLDRTGMVALIRLLFFPHLSKRSVLHKVLLNLCENAKSRTELFSSLLSILQEGTGDVAMVDKSFSQLSFKNTKATYQGTPTKVTGKHKESSLTGGPPIIPPDTPPDIVAQRCLDALSFIVSSNELSSLFFLTEHELPAGLKKNISKKGKGKEKQSAQTYYPIVLLLGLLERQSLLKTSSIMDAVAGLLDAVTRPLTSLKDVGKAGKAAENVVGAAEAIQQGTEVGSTLEPTTAEAGSNATPAPAQAGQQDSLNKGSNVESMEEKLLLANPPQIPHPALRSIVNILTIGECSGRTFQHTLALIQHLSFLADARGTVAQELKVKAHDFGSNLQADLDELITALNTNTQDDLPASVVTRFSPASSDQAKLLRVLKTIDYMYSSAVNGSAATQQQPEQPDDAREIYETFRFTPLWQKLGDCLTVVEQKTDIENVATILLPLIESLMVVCKNAGVKSSSSHLGLPGSPRSPLPSEQSVDELFVTFTDDHRKVLNLMVRNNPSLMSGSFSLLVQNSRVLDFDNKRNYFNQQLRRRPHPRDHYGSLQLSVRRARVFEDSFHAFQHKTGDQIKYGKMSVRFYGEEGVDAGGLTREWFQILARQMFDPNYALFEPCAADRQTYQPNRASAINPDHLSYFKFVGRVIGKAIYDGRLMDAHFARSLYRQLLGKPVDYRDVEWVDPDYYKSLCWILENDPTMLDLTFITEVDEFGKHAVIELKENGATTLVTTENRKEYVQLSAQYRLTSSIKDQIEHLLSGFYEVVPKDLISIFNEQEVELLISGTPDIDVDEWRAATEYNGYTSSDPVIVWWWRALKSFNRDERAKVLSFATGTSRVPLGGFVDLQGVQGNQRFSIHKAYGNPDRLPQAHTCFNQIDLPEYTSYEKLRQQLLLAINEGGEGFGFA